VDRPGLTEEEVALVLRRAAELDHPPLPAGAALDDATLEEAAVDAGLSRAAVRQALAELRAGLLAPAHPDPGRGLLRPPVLAVRRALPGRRQEVAARLHQFLERELFELLRDRGERTTWAASGSLRARVQRRVDQHVQRRLILRDVSRVDVTVVDDPGSGGDRALALLEVDVRPWRRGEAALLGGGAAAGLTVAAGGLVLLGPDIPASMAAVASGGGLVAAGHTLGVRYYRANVGAIATSLEGVLDRIERGTWRPEHEPEPDGTGRRVRRGG
jgi:DNA-binding transcriptional ArsR family regulator